jgi:tripartite-type tricarboxylate transporter receptor subunit TctC
MSMPVSRRAVIGAALAAPAIAKAQLHTAYPSRPVRVIVPFTAAGATDAVGRITAERLGALLGGTFVVENRAGAGGTVGSEAVAKSEPDGYTLLIGTIAVSSIGAHLYPRLAFDPIRDFANIAYTSHVANGVIVRADLPAKTLAELLAMAKARPGQVTYGTPGNGTSGHLSGEYLKYRAGVDLQHVPYRGSAGAVTDLVAGRLDICIDNLPAYLPHIREGKLRLLAVTTAERWFATPDVPTVAEAADLPGYAATPWWGLQAPAGTPRPILEKLAEATVTAFREPETAARLRGIGIEAHPLPLEQFDRLIASEHAKWGEVIRAAHIRAE